MALARSDLLAEEKKKLSKMNVVSLSKNVTEDDPSKAKEAEKKGTASARGKGWVPEPLPPHDTFLLQGCGGSFLS